MKCVGDFLPRVYHHGFKTMAGGEDAERPSDLKLEGRSLFLFDFHAMYLKQRTNDGHYSATRFIYGLYQ
jgi:hypothetical protein